MKQEGACVFVVTPIYNRVSHTIEFIESLKESSYKNLRIVIVDDGSTDNSVAIISNRFPEVSLLKTKGNLWWSGATNVGVEYALKNKADFIFTVNNDVILDKNSIAKLVEEAKVHPRTLIGSIIRDIDNRNYVWYFGGFFNKDIGDLSHVTGSVNDFKGARASEWLTGMGVLIPVEVFNKIGLYDAKNFPQYHGDADFSLRAKKAGFKLIVSSKSVIFADLDSSWLGKEILDKSLSFIPAALFSTKSQFNIIIRCKFYWRHWKIRYLARFYKHFFSSLVKPLIKHKLKKLLGRQ